MTENDDERREDLFLGRWERRDVARAAIGLGGVSAIGGLAVPLSGLTQVAERGFTGEIYTDGTYLVDENGDRVTEDALEFGTRTTVFPETNPGASDAPTLLVRYEENAYAPPTELAFTVSGYAAYSKVCTHAGCMVSEAENGTLVCPCHFAEFDPRSGAAVTGGPAPRPLPQLPITLSSDGYLMATDNFEGPIGPGGE
ncbi:Rieske Fe-S protein [Halanaeroarchaeum sp. HSR-CO]|uniref:QcrA and Rieske domain-containing protein n=1 Tax=Halanaeroarchaeum sp. HSR-CO TaxID=2866382 RepID=UPI00217EF370|nr:Rieske (2Fe-2S) protein [Halanaeroarchaeum sp. HSR-CO]UWG48540.1 Rieske Fe-S protein [Halanaeroarchaeum sp. HSR-CO]